MIMETRSLAPDHARNYFPGRNSLPGRHLFPVLEFLQTCLVLPGGSSSGPQAGLRNAGAHMRSVRMDISRLELERRAACSGARTLLKTRQAMMRSNAAMFMLPPLITQTTFLRELIPHLHGGHQRAAPAPSARLCVARAPAAHLPPAPLRSA